MNDNELSAVEGANEIDSNRAIFETIYRSLQTLKKLNRVLKVAIDGLEDVELALTIGRNQKRISRTTNPHPLSEKIKNYLGDHFNENLSLPNLAEIAKITPEALSRLFKKDWGKSPIQFRNWLRIMDSFRHIAEKEAIIDTAYEVGFNDLSRFHKQFKANVGYSPLSIRTRSKNAKI